VPLFTIEYEFDNHGWATVVFKNNNQKTVNRVSYLHDSLNDLAQMAIELRDGAEISKSLFMDEPGEVLLTVDSKNGNAICEVRRYRDWASWGIIPDTEFEVLLSGKNSTAEIIQQISGILENIHDNIGLEEYKRRWIKHDFPMEKYRQLINN